MTGILLLSKMLTAEAVASPASVLTLIIHFVGLCPTPYFLFAAQKGSEKDTCGFAASKFSFLVFLQPLSIQEFLIALSFLIISVSTCAKYSASPAVLYLLRLTLKLPLASSADCPMLLSA